MPHKNSFPDLHYPKMIKSTVEIVHIINSVFFQIGLFYLLMNSKPENKIENSLFYATVVLDLLGYIMYRYFKNESVFNIIFSQEFFNDVKTILFLTMILLMLTPVLGNLTASVSTNTICFFYATCVFIHLIQYDFQMIINMPEMTQSIDQISLTNNLKQHAKEESPSPLKKPDSSETKVFSPMSINAIFFASILISSRLNNNNKVFTLLYISLNIFGWMPIIRHIMRHRMRYAYDMSALLSCIVLATSILNENKFFGILYISLIVFISFISPLIFIYAYTFKNDIRGPWDCPQIK